MTPEQRKAHERMLATLPGRKILAEEELDDPKNWAPYNRELTPAEKFHAQNAAANPDCYWLPKNGDKRPLVIYGQRYPSMKHAAKALGVSQTKIYYMLGEAHRFNREEKKAA